MSVQEMNPSRRPGPNWLVVTLIVIAAVGLAGLGGWLISCKPGTGSISALFAPQRAARSDLGDTFNILLVGRDARLVGDPSLDGKRRNKRENLYHSDVIIIAHFNLPLRRVTLMSIPRDMLVAIPGFSHPDDRLDFREMDKITHASAFGRDSLLRKTVENNYGIRIRREMALDFDSFRMSFGLLQPFLGKLAFGNRELGDPEQALMFVRDRRHYANDDLDRSRHSVLFVKTIIQRIWRRLEGRFASWLASQMLALLGSDTDVSVDDLQYIIGELRRREFSPDSIETAVMVGEEVPVTLYAYGQTLSCCLPVYRENQKQLDYYLHDKLDAGASSFMEQNQRTPRPSYVFASYDPTPDPAPAESPNPEYRRTLPEKDESPNRDGKPRADSLERLDTTRNPFPGDTAKGKARADAAREPQNLAQSGKPPRSHPPKAKSK